jgi:hypothetical protein
MSAPQPTIREDIKEIKSVLKTFGNKVIARIHNFEERIQGLEQQNHALEQRVHDLEEENQTLKVVQRRSTIPESMDLDASDAGHQMVEDAPEDPFFAWAMSNQPREGSPVFSEEPVDFSLEEEVINESPEYVPSPARPQPTPSPEATTEGTNYTVWYENGTLHTNAPAHLLTTRLDLLTAFTATSAFFTTHIPRWRTLTHARNCIRGVVHKQTTPWTVTSPGEYCCKRCMNTQRVCVKYNAESERLEALPLPEEVRSEEFGVG